MTKPGVRKPKPKPPPIPGWRVEYQGGGRAVVCEYPTHFFVPVASNQWMPTVGLYDQNHDQVGVSEPVKSSRGAYTGFKVVGDLDTERGQGDVHIRLGAVVWKGHVDNITLPPGRMPRPIPQTRMVQQEGQ